MIELSAGHLKKDELGVHFVMIYELKFGIFVVVSGNDFVSDNHFLTSLKSQESSQWTVLRISFKSTKQQYSHYV